MIRFGPAGIPLSCKGRTLKDGIEDVHNLGLNAMEIQMVRVNVIERYPDEDEVGKSPLEIESDLIMEIIRDDKGITNLEEEIVEDDILITLASGLVQNFQELKDLGRMGKQLDVCLSMHTPYYMDLASNSDLTHRSIDNVRWAGTMTHHMSGDIVVTHLGLYGHHGENEAKLSITENISALMRWWESNGLKPLLGLETSGRQEVFGSLEEIIEICDQVKGVVPVINFAHLHARESGALREPEDFGHILDKTKDLVGNAFYTHFSGVEHEAGNEKRVTPIKKGDLRFEPLAEYLVENMPEITIISSSPLLEHDAMYMKVIFERALTKMIAKQAKSKKPEKLDQEDEDDYYEEEKIERKSSKKPSKKVEKK
jgi:deoxyribonuclease-4